MKTTFALATLLFACSCFAGESDERLTKPDQAGSAKSEEATEVATGQVAADNRMICERKKALGSNRIERICMTRSQRAAARERARNDLQRLGGCSGNENACARSL